MEAQEMTEEVEEEEEEEEEERMESGERKMTLVVQVDSSDALEPSSAPSEVLGSREVDREASVASRESSEASVVQVSLGMGVAERGGADEGMGVVVRGGADELERGSSTESTRVDQVGTASGEV